MIKLNEYQQYYNTQPIYYTSRYLLDVDDIPLHRRKYNKQGVAVNEAVSGELFDDFPVNRRLPFNQELMIKAINYGMIIKMSYAGDKDDYKGGRDRTIYPMVLGVNKNTGNMLLRGWHLDGWSVHERKYTKNVWRLFKTTNIKNMTFIGDFYRLAPAGYRMNDRIMTERTVIAADFNTIRKNQQALVNARKVQVEEEQNIGGGPMSSKVSEIDIRNTDSKLDLLNPFLNKLIDRRKLSEVKLVFMKSIFGNQYIAVLGARSEANKTVKVYEDKKFLGNFKVLKVVIGDELNRTKNVNGTREFDLYTFNKLLK